MVRWLALFTIPGSDLPDLRYHFKCLELNERVAEDIRERFQRSSALVSLLTSPHRGICLLILPREDWPQYCQ